jgi:hypothetical protein
MSPTATAPTTTSTQATASDAAGAVITRQRHPSPLHLGTTQAQLQRAFVELLTARDAMAGEFVPATPWGTPDNGQGLQDRYVWALGRYQASLDAHINACIGVALARHLGTSSKPV